MRVFPKQSDEEGINWRESVPFIILHFVPLAAFWTGARAIDFMVCFGLYYVRMFFITAGYHRYFSHKSYELSRPMQFLMAFGGGTAAQKGALWWAAHHRHHHRYSDTVKDIHTPKRGLWWSHVGWILANKYKDTEFKQIKDFAKYPELVWLNKYHYVPPVVLGTACFLIGGPSMLFVGFFLSTVILYHGTFTINSFMHLFGRRRYVTSDTSRNSMIFALITCGEGWHNNHHYYQAAARQGFFWWELDFSYYVIKIMSWVGLAKNLRQPPKAVLQSNLVKQGHADIGMFEAYWDRAAMALTNARKHTGEIKDAQKKAIEEFVVSTREKAEELARVSSSATLSAADS